MKVQAKPKGMSKGILIYNLMYKIMTLLLGIQSDSECRECDVGIQCNLLSVPISNDVVNEDQGNDSED